MSNVLPLEKQITVLEALTEGLSVRSTERLLRVNRRTVLSLLVSVGEGCERLLDRMMRNLSTENVELDEAWSFVGKKQRHVDEEFDDVASVGDTWIFIAIDSDSKLIPCYRIGKRDAVTANAFVADLAARVTKRVQITTDGLALYVDAIERGFGAHVDYAQLLKQYEAEPMGPGRYSPPKVTSADRLPVMGNPDPKKICTSFVERQNLTMRMKIRRMTRLTNAFSKKLRNHKAAIALHLAAYNLTAIHGTLRVTPAMAAGITDHVWSMHELYDAALTGVVS